MLMLAAAGMVMTGCRSAGTVADTAPAAYQATMHQAGPPPARVYRTSADYAANVPVTLNEQRTALVSYPDPADLRQQSSPVPLADGWMLDRRGISANSAFLTYTYAQYAALDRAPDEADIMAAIIPDARVTEIGILPMTLQKAQADTAAVNRMLTGDTPGFDIIWRQSQFPAIDIQ